MASFSRYGGGWRAQVARRGVRRSATFTSKGAAIVWASQVEGEILAGARGEVPNLTVLALLERYRLEVSIRKKGRRPEGMRLKAIGRDQLAQVRLRQLDTPHASDWQRRRLAAVSEASVRRERNLLNHVFQVAVKEWRWLRKNPFDGVRRPKDSRPRRRIASPAEIDRLTAAASDRLRRAIVFALETGMRAGEIGLPPSIKGRVAYLADTKNGEEREVPLSARAIEALGTGIDLTAGSISELFARLCERLGIDGLTFHDLRHTAATNLSKKLDTWELCKMFGWKDPRIALNTYYRADTEEMAKKL